MNVNINVNVINNGKLVEQNEPLINFFETNNNDTMTVVELVIHCLPLISGESQYVTWDEIHSGKWSVEVVRDAEKVDENRFEKIYTAEQIYAMHNTKVVVLRDDEAIFSGKYIEYIDSIGVDEPMFAHFLDAYSDVLDEKEMITIEEFQDGTYRMIRV